MAETPKSLLQQVIEMRDADVDGDFVVLEAINEKLAQLHQVIMEALMVKGLGEEAATKAAHELLQLDPEYTDLIGGSFDKEDVEAMKQRLLRFFDKFVFEELRSSVANQLQGILHNILAMDV